MKKRGLTIGLIAIVLAGLALLLYPSFSDYWNSMHQSRAVMNYAETVANIDDSTYRAMWDSAEEYNRRLLETGMRWRMTDEEKEEYNSLLNITDAGIMAYIDIPKISCTLPIYHGTDESVLQTAVGHLESSSLPVGGTGTHCIISGHRGLPSARLFTDLDKMVVGDEFTINTLDEILTYEVDQILIVEPADLSALQIERKQDYVTLVTCTPYGINTHRLLVRGHRIDTVYSTQVRVTSDAIQIDKNIVAPILAAPVLLLLVILMLITTRRKRSG